MSMIRIVDRINLSVSGRDTPEDMPAAIVNLTLVLGFKSGFVRGPYSVRVKALSPSQQVLITLELPMLLEGDDRGGADGAGARVSGSGRRFVSDRARKLRGTSHGDGNRVCDTSKNHWSKPCCAHDAPPAHRGAAARTPNDGFGAALTRNPRLHPVSARHRTARSRQRPSGRHDKTNSAARLRRWWVRTPWCRLTWRAVRRATGGTAPGCACGGGWRAGRSGGCA